MTFQLSIVEKMGTFLNKTIHIVPKCVMHLHGHHNKMVPLTKPFILADISNGIKFRSCTCWSTNDSRPQNVGNQLNFQACRWSAIHGQKAFDESYNFALDLVPIGGLSAKLQPRKVARGLSQSLFLISFQSSITSLYLSKVLRARERVTTPCPFTVLCLGLTFGSFKELGVPHW